MVLRYEKDTNNYFDGAYNETDDASNHKKKNGMSKMVN